MDFASVSSCRSSRWSRKDPAIEETIRYFTPSFDSLHDIGENDSTFPKNARERFSEKAQNIKIYQGSTVSHRSTWSNNSHSRDILGLSWQKHRINDRLSDLHGCSTFWYDSFERFGVVRDLSHLNCSRFLEHPRSKLWNGRFIRWGRGDHWYTS
jgi:hypothetical protein